MARSRQKRGGGNLSCIKMRDENGKVIRDGLGRAKFFSGLAKMTRNPVKIAARQRELAARQRALEEARQAEIEQRGRMRAEGGF